MSNVPVNFVLTKDSKLKLDFDYVHDKKVLDLSSWGTILKV